MAETQNPQGQQSSEGIVAGITLESLVDGAFATSPAVPSTQQEDSSIPPDAPIDTPPANPNSPATPPATPPSSVIEDEVQLLLSGNEKYQSPEDVALRANILTTFAATGVDTNGNLVGTNGQVVLSKEALNNYIETGELPIDEEGNQINALGEIITKAEDLTPASSFIELSKLNIENEFGFELKDKDGKPKVYANTVEANTELIKDVADNVRLSAVSSFLASMPELKDIYFHLANGGNIKDFQQLNTDYSAIDVNTLDREAKLSYIKTSFEQQGLKNASSLLKTLEQTSDEALTQTAADAIIALNQLSEDKKIQREQEFALNQEREQKALTEYWDVIKSVISTGKLKDITIPTNEKEEFFKYLAVPINSKGESQEMVDAEGEDNEFRLMLSYLRFKKYNLNDFISLKAKGDRLQQLRDRAKNLPVPKIENASARTKNNNSGNAPTLDILY